MQLIIPLIFVLVLVFISSIFFRNSPKRDKGFEVIYFKLSYRRKMIRKLMTLPFAIVVMVLLYVYSDISTSSSILVGSLILIVFFIQFLYNFFMWKEKEVKKS